jgi:hypothetical protein
MAGDMVAQLRHSDC